MDGRNVGKLKDKALYDKGFKAFHPSKQGRKKGGKGRILGIKKPLSGFFVKAAFHETLFFSKLLFEQSEPVLLFPAELQPVG